MGRNIRNVNLQILNRLKEYVDEEDRFRIRSDISHRFFFSENVYKIVEKIEVAQMEDFTKTNIVCLKYEDTFYIATKRCDCSSVLFSGSDEIGLDVDNRVNKLSYYNLKDTSESEEDEEDRAVRNHGDLFIAINFILFLKGFLSITLKSMEIVTAFFDWSETKEYPPSEILPYFTKCRIYKMSEDMRSMFWEDLERWSVQLDILERKEKLRLAEKEDYLQEAFDFLNVDSSRSVVEIIKEAVLMDNPKSIYLQFFRTLEYLFILRRGIDISEKYNQLNRDELIKHYSNDGFWEREDESVKKLISKYASQSTKNEYIQYLCSIGYINFEEMNANDYLTYLRLNGHTTVANEKIIQTEEKKLAEYVYECRNIIAHYKYGQPEMKGENSLKQSIKYLVKMITSIYQNMNSVIEEIHINTNSWKVIEFSMR